MWAPQTHRPASGDHGQWHTGDRGAWVRLPQPFGNPPNRAPNRLSHRPSSRSATAAGEPPAAPGPRLSGTRGGWGGGMAAWAPPPDLPPPCVTFRRVVVPLRGPGQSPVLPFACCVGSLRSVGRCGRCSCWCRFRVCGAQRLVLGLCHIRELFPGNEIHRQGPKLEVNFRSTNRFFLLASDPAPHPPPPPPGIRHLRHYAVARPPSPLPPRAPPRRLAGPPAPPPPPTTPTPVPRAVGTTQTPSDARHMPLGPLRPHGQGFP